ncbi:S8 family serine peptidase [Paenibacillus thalictri]|uniref:S8 family serine peptidase n=1 Tax=Paenibacillus thalictri TaxID=2527873 RepID=UPI0013EF48D2|nr:S8 family serine peptidase [Paenibacillus thalictri]
MKIKIIKLILAILLLQITNFSYLSLTNAADVQPNMKAVTSVLKNEAVTGDVYSTRVSQATYDIPSQEKLFIIKFFDYEKGITSFREKKRVFSHSYKNIPMVTAKLSQKDKEEIKLDNNVAFIEEDHYITKTSNIPQNLKEFNALETLGTFKKEEPYGPGVRVAILDTGIDVNNSQLQIAGGISFIPTEPSYSDYNGHGTHVAGIFSTISGITGGGQSWVELFSEKVMDRNGKGTYSGVIQAVDWAIDQKMDIISMSFTGDEYSPALKEVMERASEKGILLIAPSGNEGRGEVLYPAAFPTVLAVGAVDQNNKLAYFSNTGREIDLVAPGVNVKSLYLNNEFTSLSGTSMAVPHVAGVAALIKKEHTQFSNEDLTSIIKKTATRLGEPQKYGKGLVNAARALEVASRYKPHVKGKTSVSDSVYSAVYSTMSSVQKSLIQAAGYTIPGSLNNNSIQTAFQIALNSNSFSTSIIAGEAKYFKITNDNGWRNIGINVTVTPSPGGSLSCKVINPQDNKSMRCNDLRAGRDLSINTANDFFYVQVNGYNSTDYVLSLEIKADLDTIFEPNETFDQAKSIEVGASYPAWIWDKYDEDFYEFIAPMDGVMEIKLYADGVSPFAAMYNSNREIVGYIEDYEITNDSRSQIRVNAGQKYYLEIYSDNPVKYSFYVRQLDLIHNSSLNLKTNQPLDIDSAGPVVVTYSFDTSTPVTFYTDRYGGYGPLTDVEMYLFEDAELTKKIEPANYFSDIKSDESNKVNIFIADFEAISNHTYYLKVIPRNGSNVHLRLGVAQEAFINSPINYSWIIDYAPNGWSKYYKFTAPRSGEYKFIFDRTDDMSYSYASYVSFCNDAYAAVCPEGSYISSGEIKNKTLFIGKDTPVFVGVYPTADSKIRFSIVESMDPNEVLINTIEEGSNEFNILFNNLYSNPTTLLSFTPIATGLYSFDPIYSSDDYNYPRAITELFRPFELNNKLLLNSLSVSMGNKLLHYLQQDVTYYFAVYANSPFKDETIGEFNKLKVSLNRIDNDSAPPSIPTNLSIAENTGTQMTLTWTESSDDVGVSCYEIFVDDLKVGETTSTSFTYHNKETRIYNFAIRAVDYAIHKSAFSTLSVMTKDIQAPTTPTNLRLSLTSSVISLSWSASSDNMWVESYDIYNGTELITSVSGNVTTFSFTLFPGTAYHFTVRARDTSGNISATSEVLTLTDFPTNFTYMYDLSGKLVYIKLSLNKIMTEFQYDENGNLVKRIMKSNIDPVRPSEPWNLQVTLIQDTSTVNLSWTRSTDNVEVVGYDIYNNDNIFLRSTTANSISLTGLPNGNYSFNVRAKDASGNLSSSSLPVNIQIKP